MKNLLLIAAALLALSSCTVTRERCNQLYPPVVVHSVDTFMQVTEVLVHDTTYVKPDTSVLVLTFVADSQNNVHLVDTLQRNGQRGRTGVSTRRIGNTLQAMVTCLCDSLNIYHVFKDRDTTLRITATDTQIHQVNVPAQLTWWQLFKIDYGGYALGFIALYLLLRIAWWVIRTYTSIQFPGAGVISKIL